MVSVSQRGSGTLLQRLSSGRSFLFRAVEFDYSFPVPSCMPVKRLRSRLATIAQVLSLALLAVWVVGQILRDCNWWIGLMFYFPTPVLVAWLSLLAGVSQNKRLFYLGLLIAPVLMLLSVENQWIRPLPPGMADSSPSAVQHVSMFEQKGNSPQRRLVHWNLARGVMGWEQQWRHIESLRPDIIVLSEIPQPFDSSMLPGFNVLTVDCMAVGCHGTMTTSGTLIRGSVLQAFHVTCKLDDDPLELMVADMTSNIAVPRDPYLRQFAALLEERRIDLSVGDFNAPRRSLAFCELPKGFQHAYDAVGSGWSCTWPVPVAFLAIDQCITGPGIVPVHYELQSTMLSDHRLQILDFKVAGEMNGDHANPAF